MVSSSPGSHGPNAIWVFIPMFGLYVSVRLILDGTYGVLGF